MTKPQAREKAEKVSDAIWNAFHKVSDLIHLEHAIRSKERQIEDLRPACGTCDFWMKTTCPMEVNINGRRRGPSMNGLPCSKHQEVGFVTALRKERQSEIVLLKDRLNERTEND